MCQHIQQHLGIGIRIDMPAIFFEHFDLEPISIGEITVVRQRNAKGSIYIKRLCLFLTRRSGSRIAALSYA